MGCHSNGAIFAVSSEIVVETAYRNKNPRPGYADEVQYSQKCIRGEKRDLRYPCETGELASQHCPQLSSLARQFFPWNERPRTNQTTLLALCARLRERLRVQ